MVDREKVRLLIADTDDPPNQVYTDAQIDGFIDIADNNIFMAAYYAVLAIATDSTALSKMERIGNYTCDRKSIANNYIALADKYKQTAQETPAIAFGQWAVSDFQARDLIFNRFLSR